VTYAIKTASYRAATEDRALVVPLPNDGLVVVIADGAGGIGGGGQAAVLAVETVQRKLGNNEIDGWSPEACCAFMTDLDRAIEAAPQAGESTLVVVVVGPDGNIVGASVGDSGAMIASAAGAVDDLTAEQHRKRRLGSGRAVPVGFSRKRWTGTLVVASDGLWAYARPERVAHVVLGCGGLDMIGERLVQLVRLPSGDLMDDLTVVLVRPP